MGTSQKGKEFREKLSREYEESIPGKGAKTSDYYNISNIPSRFNNPDLMGTMEPPVVHNSGNPVFTCASNPKDMFDGYEKKEQHPMYRTSGSDYGSTRPSVHTMPSAFHAKSQTFTEQLGKCGMFRNNSLNTSVDKSRASNHLDGLF